MHPLRVGAGTEQPVPVGIDLSLYCDGHHRGHLPLGRWERGQGEAQLESYELMNHEVG